MHIRYPRTYKRLKAIGFSPAKADKIILDAHRGISIAMMWIRIAFRSRA